MPPRRVGVRAFRLDGPGINARVLLVDPRAAIRPPLIHFRCTDQVGPDPGTARLIPIKVGASVLAFDVDVIREQANGEGDEERDERPWRYVLNKRQGDLAREPLVAPIKMHLTPELACNYVFHNARAEPAVRGRRDGRPA